MSTTLADQLQRTISALDTAETEHAHAVTVLGDALIAEYQARLQLEYEEVELTEQLYREGVPGKNEAERKTLITVALLNMGDVRAAHETTVIAKIAAEHDYRRVDVRQKALRATLAALTALCGIQAA